MPRERKIGQNRYTESTSGSCTAVIGSMTVAMRAQTVLAEGEIPEGYEINHLDENKQNNALNNLSLTSHVENCNWKSRNERMAAKLKNHPLKSKSVIAIDKDGNVIYKFESTMEAGRKGFNQGHVAACCRGERRMHKGLRWYYA